MIEDIFTYTIGSVMGAVFLNLTGSVPAIFQQVMMEVLR